MHAGGQFSPGICSGEASIHKINFAIMITPLPTYVHTLSPHTGSIALSFSVKDIVSLPVLSTGGVADGLTATGVCIEGPLSLNNKAENFRVCWVGWLNTLTYTDQGISCHYPSK